MLVNLKYLEIKTYNKNIIKLKKIFTNKKNQKKKMEMLIKNPRYKWFSNCN